MSFAVVNIAGSQAKVEKGTRVQIPELSDKKEGDKVSFDEVLMISKDGKTVELGSPTIKGAKVEAKVIRHGKSKKLRVFTMRRRKRTRTTQGVREGFTELEVTKV